MNDYNSTATDGISSDQMEAESAGFLIIPNLVIVNESLGEDNPLTQSGFNEILRMVATPQPSQHDE